VTVDLHVRNIILPNEVHLSKSLILNVRYNNFSSNLDAEVPGQLAKKFHFQELEWIITFPDLGNERKKYPHYSVFFSDRKEKSAGKLVCLVDVVENPEFQERFPHTVGFFKCETDDSLYAGSNCLEVRIVRSVEDFWKFLNDLDL